jgi:hypothetical protein
MRFFRISLPALLLTLSGAAASGSLPTGFVIRVPQDVSTIQLGINLASDGDTVLVSEGNYFENIDYRGKRIVVAGLTIRDGDTAHISRTVIDGSTPAHPDTGSVVRFVSEEDSNAVLYGFTIRNGTGTRFGGTTPPFLTAARVGGGIFCFESGPRILHTVVRNNSLAGDTTVGAGIYAVAYARKPHIIVEGCIIRGNAGRGIEQAWGGGGSFHGLRGRISGNIIEGNTLASHGSSLGGGLDLWRYRADTITLGLVLDGNRIVRNSAVAYDGAWGGGLISTEGSFRIAGNTVDSNLVRDTVGGAYGGGMHIEDGGLTGPVGFTTGNRIRWNVAESNTAAYGGGMVIHTEDARMTGEQFTGNGVSAPAGHGAALARILGTSQTVVDRSVFSGNSGLSGSSGGTIYVSQSDGFLLSRSRIEGNSTTQGGALHLDRAAFRLENCLIRNNGAGEGGAFYVSGVPTAPVNRHSSPHGLARPGLSGGLTAPPPPALSQEIMNCTVASNAAILQGGAIYATGAAPVMMNCILWGDTAGSGGNEIHVASGDLQVRYSDVRGGWAGSGNIDTDPLADESSGHLDDASPCIGKGIDTMLVGGEWYYAPLTDLDGGIRPAPWGSLPDIGACESPLSLPGGVLRSYTVSRGWDMISLPLTLADYRKQIVFPTASSEAFAFQGTYVARTTLENSIGYWLKFDSVHIVPMTGLLRSLDTIRVDTGWSIIGAISAPIDTGAIVKDPPWLLRSPYFGYSPTGYQVAGTIEPMHAYWVRVAVPGILVLSASVAAGAPGSSVLDGLGSIHISDAAGAAQKLFFGPDADPAMFAMPPPPPSGALNVRFASGSLVTATDQTIHASGGTYPIRFTLEEGAREDAVLVLDGRGGGASGVSLVLPGPGASVALRFRPSAGSPSTFELRQNYPNPFNPTTEIRFGLPEAARVSVTVVDLLGRRVADIAGGPHDAGYHTVTWNAAGMARGV